MIVDDFSLFDCLNPFCFLFIEFHCTFSISYKIQSNYAYYYYYYHHYYYYYYYYCRARRGVKAKKCLYEGVIAPMALYGAEGWCMRSAKRRKVYVVGGSV